MNVDFYRWDLVILFTSLALVFAYGVLRPRRESEWRSAGLTSAWIIALYAEMYGLPLTLYLASATIAPHLDTQDFQHGHLWAPLFELSSCWQLLFVITGQLLIALGGLLALIGWRQLWAKRQSIAQHGIYGYIRHPQYTGFFLFIFGSLLNWPTLATLLMAPVLVFTYYRLAVREEEEMQQKWGKEYQRYQARTGRFFPRA